MEESAFPQQQPIFMGVNYHLNQVYFWKPQASEKSV